MNNGPETTGRVDLQQGKSMEFPAGDGQSGVPVPAAQQTIGNVLLSDIVSRLGDSQATKRPMEPASPVAFPVSRGMETENMPVHQQITQVASAAGGADTAIVGQTIGAYGLITLGTATLALTPGLSTTVGSDSDATFVAITTDSTGQTFITISSSGTAVTATVSDTSATITLPKTDFEASITDVARPGTWSTSRVAGAVASTSSRGDALTRRGEASWWAGVLLGILGYRACL